MTQKEDALKVASRGLEVFPARNKQPLVKWQADATTDYDVISSWWDRWPDAEIGMPMPPGTVAVDIDDLAATKLAEARGELWFAPSNGQQTRSGGFHFFYHTDGRDVPQVVRRGGIKLDTRVGGKGYVIVYDEASADPATWGNAMEWLYEEESSPPARPSDALPQPMGTRDEVLSWLGTFSARGINLTAKQYEVLLRSKRDEGGIVALDPARPWTDGDLRKLASEASKWEVGRMLLSPILRGEDAVIPTGLAGMDAADLLKEEIAPLEWAFEGLLQEGLVVIGAPPKAGKSLLAYQMCVHLVMGVDLLGCAARKRPVRYYALEDGKRRSQSRIRNVLQQMGGARMQRGLDLRWTAPHLDGPLEAECDEYLQANPGGVIVIDVLAKVRPTAGTSKNLNAYDADYNLLSKLHTVAKAHPGSTIVVVTHDRKAGSEDWVSRVTGTRGVTGVADSIIYIDRKRGEMTATIYVTGRDAQDWKHNVEFTGDGWRPVDITLAIASLTPTRQLIYQHLAAHGPARQKDIAEATGINLDNVYQTVKRMSEAGELQSVPGGYIVKDLTAVEG